MSKNLAEPELKGVLSKGVQNSTDSELSVDRVLFVQR
jgi:hypothetical protein